jgi:predicted transcriptional regulator
MSKTVSFVARDELADWLERRAEEQMKSISAVCQDIVAAEYRRQQQDDGDKTGQTQIDADQSDDPEREALKAETEFEFESKAKADGARADFSEYLSENDDKRFKQVRFEKGTPGEVVEELERWSNS